MRVAAVAFVLIVGAAVVLWFGNTLNSWVLGGLIGGLAAILLSIPITLTLFTYLARRHDERQQAEAQEETSLAQMHTYQARRAAVYEAEEYGLPAEDEWSEENSRYQIATARNLPVPTPSRLPEKRQMQPPVTTNQRATDYTLARRRAPETEQRPTRELSEEQRKPSVQRINDRRQGYYPGFYGHQTKSTRGMHQTAALKAARMEAMQQAEDERMYTSPLRPGSIARHVDSGTLPAHRSRQYHPERMVEGSSQPPRSGRLLPASSDQPSYQHTDRLPQTGAQRATPTGDPHTDKIDNRYPTTGPMRVQPRTGQFTRQPHLEPQPRHPDIITGSVSTPMVRRAPYLYEDDPLREELARQIEPPSVRRSSRLYEQYEDDEA